MTDAEVVAQYVLFVRVRHATRPARPEVDAAYEAARGALVALVRDRGGSLVDGSTRIELGPHGELMMTDDWAYAAAARRLAARPDEGWPAPSAGAAARPVSAGDAEMLELERAYLAAVHEWCDRTCVDTTAAMYEAKRRFEAAIKSRGGRWSSHRLFPNGRLPKPTAPAPRTRPDPPDDQAMCRLEADFVEAREALHASPDDDRARRALGLAKRAFEGAIKARGGAWGGYKLGPGGWLPRSYVERKGVAP